MMKDAESRARALDTSQSFIVQAPAGSGKTELLTQRYLALLAHVERYPEQVLAITFTRKAAGEMRHRVLHWLQIAASGEKPESAHALISYDLARQVLARDIESGWSLLQNPNRLSVQTIDAFCTSLAHRLPIASRFGARPQIIEQPERCYRQAATQVLSSATENPAPSYANAAKSLLMALDNRLTLAIELVAKLLATRDQWLGHCLNASRTDHMRDFLESNLARVVESRLEKLAEVFPSELYAEAQSLFLFAQNLIDLPNDAQAFTSFLLTEEGEWRRAVTKQHGFPPTERAQKQRMLELLAALTEYPEVKEALLDVKCAPPTCYEDKQWTLLAALFELLPIVTAELHLVFKQYERVDFIEMSMRALQALGTPETPTDLMLSLDYRYQHILVDEFQDTSQTQWQLLERLTAGWHPHDGRTLFLVGDPMQSIYRFRQAEVGLFLRAQATGIGDVILQSLHLSANFRSDTRLVEWTNHHMACLFPAVEHRGRGAVAYRSAEAVRSFDLSLVNCVQAADEFDEAAHCAARISEHLAANPHESIAILVRARSHLSAICPALYAEGIPFQAIDIDPLVAKPYIQDFFMLTRAIQHDYDRIAWLALLRAPWCGIPLAVLTPCVENNPTQPMWAILQTISKEQSLQDESHQARLNRFVEALRPVIEARGYRSLDCLVEAAWSRLGGPQLLKTTQAHRDIQRCLRELQRLARDGNVEIGPQLAEQFRNLYAEIEEQGGVQVMTIHKSKGLEFDVVFLPCLGRRPPVEDSPLLAWTMPLDSEEDEDLILAPLMTDQAESDPIYRFVRRESKFQAQLEAIRVFYVAVTRAKRCLYLSGVKPEPGSYLAALWPHAEADFVPTAEARSEEKPATTISMMKRVYLGAPLANIPLAPPTRITDNPIDPAHYRWQPQTAKAVGTVVHRILCHITSIGLETFCQFPLDEMLPQWEQQLRLAHVLPRYLPHALQDVKEAITQALQCETARWILTAHPSAASEYALSGYVNGQIVHGIIDRTFIIDNVRWIIDYKMTDTTDMELLRAEYEPQLNRYALLFSSIENLAIKLGIYCPRVARLLSWDYASKRQTDLQLIME